MCRPIEAACFSRPLAQSCHSVQRGTAVDHMVPLIPKSIITSAQAPRALRRERKSTDVVLRSHKKGKLFDLDDDLALGAPCFHVSQSFVGFLEPKDSVDDRADRPGFNERRDLAQLIPIRRHE